MDGCDGWRGLRAAVAVLAVAVVAVQAVCSAAAGPARADAGDERLSLDVVRDFTTYVPSQQPAADAATSLRAGLRTGADGARDVRLTVDARDVAGVVRLSASGACAQASEEGVFTCEYGTLKPGLTRVEGLEVENADGVRDGASGTVRFRARAADVAPASAVTTVRVGGARLRVRKDARVTGVRPGGETAFTPVVANVGKRPAYGAGLSVSSLHRSMELVRAYRNCHYDPSNDRSAYCWFDRTLRPRTAYRFSAPLRLTTTRTMTKAILTTSPWRSGQYSPWASAPERKDAFSRRGEGAALTLEPLSGPVDTEDHQRMLRTEVHTTQTSDLAAYAEPGTGDGRVVVGVRNNGPGTLPSGVATFRFTPPEGTAVVAPSAEDVEEQLWQCGPTGGGAESYLCGSSGGIGMRAGDGVQQSFVLCRTAGPNSPGPGDAHPGGPGAGGPGAESPRRAGRVEAIPRDRELVRDRNADNDSVRVPVPGRDGEENGGGLADCAAGEPGGTEGGGSGFPTAATVSAGAAACAGLAALLAVRRRKRRHRNRHSG